MALPWPRHSNQGRLGDKAPKPMLIWHMLTKRQDYFWVRPAMAAATRYQGWRVKPT